MAEYKTVKTKDVNEATFYCMYGASFVNVRRMLLNKKRAEHKGYIDQWTVEVANVPSWAIDTWRTGQAYGNITLFVDVRTKLKKRIKRELGN
jgi:hypothetical protein